jgi:phosphoribosylanthranilate isomerase
MNLKIKICGMREPENILAVAELKPDFIGFIFYPDSPRFAAEFLSPEILSKLVPHITKAGVFVNADFDEITRTVRKYSLDIVQLHGNETPELCGQLRYAGIEVIKAFNINVNSDFKICSQYINCTNYFLFDTLASVHGGSGHKFDWRILDSYTSGHPLFLSGGITSIDAGNILKITNSSFIGVDLNSRFEIKPGLKDIEKLKKFISELRTNNEPL